MAKDKKEPSEKEMAAMRKKIDAKSALLARIDLMLRPDGHLSMKIDAQDPDQFVKMMDEMNPDYENTHTLKHVIGVMHEVFADANEKVMRAAQEV